MYFLADLKEVWTGRSTLASVISNYTAKNEKDFLEHKSRFLELLHKLDTTPAATKKQKLRACIDKQTSLVNSLKKGAKTKASLSKKRVTRFHAKFDDENVSGLRDKIRSKQITSSEDEQEEEEEEVVLEKTAASTQPVKADDLETETESESDI